MAKYDGNALVVKIGATAVTANLIKSVEVNRTAETHESSGAGDADKTFLAGRKGATAKIDAWDDSTAAAMRTKFAVGTVFSGGSVLHVLPQGVGGPDISFDAVVTDLTLGVPHDGTCPVSVSLLVTGAVSES